MEEETIECCTHGKSYVTYVCAHLISGESTEWHSRAPDEESPWPDSWCGICHPHFAAAGEWNEESERTANLEINLLCHNCYEAKKAKCSVHYI